MKFVQDADSAARYNRKPNFSAAKIINDNLAMIVMKKRKVKLDSLVLVGTSILEDAKERIYRFYFEYLQRYFPGKHTMLYTDTDAIIALVETPNIYEHMQECSSLFDMSEYKGNIFGKYFDETNRERLAKMKDECPNKIITKVVVLKPKMYAYEAVQLADDGKVAEIVGDMKLKGVSKSFVENQMSIEDYENTMSGIEPQTFADFTTIRS